MEQIPQRHFLLSARSFCKDLLNDLPLFQHDTKHSQVIELVCFADELIY